MSLNHDKITTCIEAGGAGTRHNYMVYARVLFFVCGPGFCTGGSKANLKYYIVSRCCNSADFNIRYNLSN